MLKQFLDVSQSRMWTSCSRSRFQAESPCYQIDFRSEITRYNQIILHTQPQQIRKKTQHGQENPKTDMAHNTATCRPVSSDPKKETRNNCTGKSGRGHGRLTSRAVVSEFLSCERMFRQYPDECLQAPHFWPPLSGYGTPFC